MSTILRLKISVIALDEQTEREKHAVLEVHDPQACILAAGPSQDSSLLDDIDSFLSDLVEHQPDGGRVVLDATTARNILGGSQRSASEGERAPEGKPAENADATA